MKQVKITNSADFHCLDELDRNYMDLCLCHCGMENCTPGHYFGPGKRTEYIIHYIQSGSGVYLRKRHTYHLSAGDAFLIWPGENIYYHADTDTPWSYAWIAFNGIKADFFTEYAGFTKSSPVIHFEDGSFFGREIQNILDTKTLTYTNELLRQSYFWKILSEIISGSDKASRKDYDYPVNTYVNQAADFIRANYNRQIHIADIAEYIGISRSYLTSNFKNILKMSPQRFLQNCRMNKARDLLKSTGLSISEIAAQVGYDDALAFSKIFKKEYGTSPTQYRQNSNTLLEL